MNKNYRLILFDCFNTLFLTHASALPRLCIDGKEVTSTAGLLCAALAPHYGQLEPPQVHAALRETWRWAGDQRGETLREISAPVRMRHLFHVLALPPPEEALVQELVWVHMEALLSSFVLPPAHLDLLRDLRGRYRLAIFSNFDYAPGLMQLLRTHHIVDWFDPIIVSDAIGYRKPGEVAFTQAIAMTGQRREEILFVGDSLEDDVQGAHGARLDVAWINHGQDAPPALPQPPTYALENLPALARVLASV